MSPEQTYRMARRRIEDWLWSEIEGRDLFRLPDLVEEGMAHFLEDFEFVQRLGLLFMRDILSNVGSDLIYQRRQHAQVGDMVVALAAGAEETTAAMREEQRVSSLIENWYEYTGEHHVRFMDATKPDLRGAIAQRQKVVDGHVIRINVMRRVAVKLKAGEPVRHRFSASDIMGMLEEERSSSGQGGRT